MSFPNAAIPRSLRTVLAILAPWALAVVALAAFVRFAVLPAAALPAPDFAPLVVAGRLLSAGQEDAIYGERIDQVDPRFQESAVRMGFEYVVTPFRYPPLVAIAMRPLAEVEYAALARAWVLASSAFLVLAVGAVLFVYLPGGPGPWTWALALGLLCVFEPATSALWLGQTTPLVMLLVCGAIWLERRGRGRLAGLALATASFVKLTPAILALVWLWRGPRRAAAYCFTTLGTLVAMSWLVAPGLQAEYLRSLRALGSSVLVSFNNHSLLAYFSRLTAATELVFGWTPVAPPRGAWLAAGGLGTLAVAATVIALSRLSPVAARDARPLAEAAAFLCLLLLPGLSWTHYFVFLLPAAAAILAVRSREERGLGFAVAAGLALCCKPILIDQAYPGSSPAARIVPGPTLAAALFWTAVVWLAWRRSGSATGSLGANDGASPEPKSAPLSFPT